MTSFPFANLPDDLCVIIIQEWIQDAKTISDLDVAFCNRNLKPQFLRWIKGMAFTSMSSLLRRAIPDSVRMSCLSWLEDRHCFLSTMDIDPAFFLSTAASRGRVLSKVRSCIIDNASLNEDTLMIMPSLSSLQSLTLESKLVSDSPFDLTPPWKALSHPELLLSLQITCTWCASAASEHLHTDLPSLTSFHVTCHRLPVTKLVQLCAGMRHLRRLYVDGGYLPDCDRESWSTFPVLSHVTQLTMHSIHGHGNVFLLDRCPAVVDLDVLLRREHVNLSTLKETVCTALCQRKLRRLTFAEDQLQRQMEAEAAHDCILLDLQEDALHSIREIENASDQDEVFTAVLHSVRRTSTTKHFALFTGILNCQLPAGELSCVFVDQLSLLRNLTTLSLSHSLCRASAESLLQLVSLPQLQHVEFDNVWFAGDAFTACMELCSQQGVTAPQVRALVFRQFKHDFMSIERAVQLLPAVFPHVAKLELRLLTFTKEVLLHVVSQLPLLRLMQVDDTERSPCLLHTMTSSDWESMIRSNPRCRRWELCASKFHWPGMKSMVDGLGLPVRIVVLTGRQKLWQDALSRVAEMREYLRDRRLIRANAFTLFS